MTLNSWSLPHFWDFHYKKKYHKHEAILDQPAMIGYIKTL